MQNEYCIFRQETELYGTAMEKPNFEYMLKRARRGTDEDWTFIDANTGPEHLVPDRVAWARKTGLADADDNIRDYSATVIARSDVPLNAAERASLVGQMLTDDYEPVRHWLANALYKRGERDLEVVATWEEAKSQDTSAGVFARTLEAA